MNALDRIDRESWAHFAPPPALTVSEWADAHRILSAESSPLPGRWKTSTTPYLAEYMNAFNDPAVETVVFWKSAQVGATEGMINAILYALACDPGPAMYLGPTLEVTGAISTDRIAPALRDCRVLRDQVGAPRGRDAANATYRKEVGHSILTLAGGNSPASVSSRPIKTLFIDEADRISASVGAEGDPVSLAIQRTRAFRRRKIFIASTPTVKGASRIEDWWNISDRRELYVPCPRCCARFVVEWHHVRWDERQPSSAYLECPTCQGHIEESERASLFAAAEWRPSAPFAGIRGYRIWAIASPWRSLAELVSEFLVAKRSIETLRVWRNTCVAELWEVPGEKLEPASLLMRREAYGKDGELPAGVCCLTMGVDTQDDRLEALVMGWARAKSRGLLSACRFSVTRVGPSAGRNWMGCLRSISRTQPADRCGFTAASWTLPVIARKQSIALLSRGRRAGCMRPSVAPAARRG
jgi:phage terminase large subunit GpA-like protein